ncbi:MAG TPA: Xaa-Pro peptidase family protein [Chloroflexia bacterium]|nr:Xaa-Pro peptidase family protein [Chloroflexia bacterium]
MTATQMANPAEVGDFVPEHLYTLDALKHRIERVRAELDARGLDSMLVSHPQNRNYLIGFGGEDAPPLDTAGMLIVGKDSLVLVTDGRYTIQAAGELYPELGIEVVARTGRVATAIAEQVARRKYKRLGFETAHLLHMIWRSLDKSLPDTDLVPVMRVVEPLRMVKSADEMELLRKAISISDQAFDIVSRRITPGMTEKQAAWDIERMMRDLGADERAFGTIMAGGPNGAMAHAVPGNRPLREGEPIVVDMGAKYRGYNSDMTRTIILGEPTDKFREIYNIVLAAHLAAERGIKAGTTGVEADKMARDVIEAAGYGDTFTHSLGHGVGLEVHEGPNFSKLSEDTMEEGNVMSVEPGIYIEGWGGVRIEDLVLVRRDDAEVLTLADKHLEY